MPFTFAHPAAVVPLHRYVGRFGVLSALVIGSMTPDLSFFLALGIPRAETHTVAALLWFCLPIGLLGYLLFHTLLKGPLLGLLPTVAFNRLGDYASRFQSLPAVSWAAVVASLLCGAMTHLVWDAFTHNHALGVRVLPFLQSRLFVVGDYQVYVYTVLQHGSTVVGLAMLAFWSWRWIRNTPVNEVALPVMLPSAQRWAVIIGIGFCAVGVGVWAGVHSLGTHTGTLALQAFMGSAIFAALPVAAFVFLAYCVSWHLWESDNKEPSSS